MAFMHVPSWTLRMTLCRISNSISGKTFHGFTSMCATDTFDCLNQHYFLAHHSVFTSLADMLEIGTNVVIRRTEICPILSVKLSTQCNVEHL